MKSTTTPSAISTKIQTLLQIKTENYRAAGDTHPDVAARFAVDGILNMYKTQAMYIEQLLDEEIEDAIKAGK